MLPVTGRPATSWVHYTTSCNTQSNEPEDGRDQRPKHVELIGINKPLLLHLVGVYIIYIYDARSNKHQRLFSFLRHTVEQLVKGSIPDGVIGIFHFIDIIFMAAIWPWGRISL